MNNAHATPSTKASDIQRSWHHVDMKGKILGRNATIIAGYLMGKTKAYYVGYLDCGDHVVVTNAALAEVTGKKEKSKLYDHFSGYPGGLKQKNLALVRSENPTRIVEEAVAGMLPKNKLRASMLKRLYIYAGDKHPHGAKIK